MKFPAYQQRERDHTMQLNPWQRKLDWDRIAALSHQGLSIADIARTLNYRPNSVEAVLWKLSAIETAEDGPVTDETKERLEQRLRRHTSTMRCNLCKRVIQDEEKETILHATQACADGKEKCQCGLRGRVHVKCALQAGGVPPKAWWEE